MIKLRGMLQKFKNIYHLFQAMIANFIYGFPGKDLICIGVTGTDGKSTVCNLIYHILRASGEKVGVISTIGGKINDEDFSTGLHTTTPSSFTLQKCLKKMVDAGCKYAVLEVASHGIDQNRIWGIPFEVGVLTNITREHLDYHKTMNEYIVTKLSFLKKCHIVVIPAKFHDFELSGVEKTFWDSFLKNDEFKSRIISTYGINGGYTRASDIKHGFFNLIPNFKQREERVTIQHNLLGRFNIENILAASAACILLGVKMEKIKKGIEEFKGIKGRLEMIKNDRNLHVFVDFAHTPNAIEQVLKTLREEFPKSKIIHVFGATGKRDKEKRPLMGEISGKMADVSIITTEDTYGENPQRIISMIEEGINKTDKKFGCTYFLEPDRQKALEMGVKMAKQGDVIVATGVGHQTSLNVGHEIEWSDQNSLREIMQNLKIKI